MSGCCCFGMLDSEATDYCVQFGFSLHRADPRFETPYCLEEDSASIL